MYDVASLAERFPKFFKEEKNLKIYKIKKLSNGKKSFYSIITDPTQKSVNRICPGWLNFFLLRWGGAPNPSGPENPLETIDFTDPGKCTVYASDL